MEIEYIDIDYILPNEKQPRKVFDLDSLEELKDSIERNGIIQPILLKKVDEGYRIVAGERRWRAAMDLNLSRVPSIVLEVDDEKEMELSIVENLQREDLNPIEEACAFKYFLDKTAETQDYLAKILGKSRSYISNSMRLLTLPKEIINYIEKGEISPGHGRAILSLKDDIAKKNLAEKICSDNLSVREAEKEVSELNKIKSKQAKSNKKKDIYTIDAEEKLTRLLGNKVTINKGKKTNKIEIEFSDENQLEYLINLLENRLNI